LIHFYKSFRYLLTKMVALPKLPNCCACASLKTGTLIIGSLNLVASVIGILASIGFMAGSTALIDVVEQMLDQGAPGWREDIDRQAISSGIFIFGVIILIASIFATAISACLVHGARTRNVCLMKPWIVLTGISLILDIFNILKALISLAIADAISSTLGWVLGAYLFLVVWSFKNEIEDEVGAGGDYQGEVHYKREEREMLKA
jgi:hypothetical protein